MDGSYFDYLTRSLAVSETRRRFLAGLAAGALGLVGRGGADAAICRAVGRTCRAHANCCSGRCGLRDATGHRHCACQTAADCPEPADGCLAAACTAGVCGTAPANEGTACGPGRVCVHGVCAGNGSCSEAGAFGCGDWTTCQTLPPFDLLIDDARTMCGETVEGGVACFGRPGYCAGGEGIVQPCSSTADCPVGFACFTSAYNNACWDGCLRVCGA
jgi:hypothetical protein